MATKVRNSTQRFTRNERSSKSAYRNNDTDFSAITSFVASRRKDNLNKYVAETSCSSYELASNLELSHERTLDLLNGKVLLSNEFATHIEEMLSLPASWLDYGGPIRGEQAESAKSTQYLPTTDVSHAQEALINSRASDPTPYKEEKIMSTLVPDIETAQEVLNETSRRVMQPVSAVRRENIIMLTERRGSKNVLATLSNMNGSRISLMTSGRKPVSEQFSKAIERALSLPPGWLDTAHTIEEVPGNVWELLGGGPGQKQTSAKVKIETLHIPEQTVDLSEYQSLFPHNQRIAESLPRSRVLASPKQPTAHKVASIFEKTPGQTGPIAEALAKTVLRLSASDQLSESKAFQLLGLLVE